MDEDKCSIPRFQYKVVYKHCWGDFFEPDGENLSDFNDSDIFQS